MFLQLANEAAVKCEPFRVTHVRRLNYACLIYANKIFFFVWAISPAYICIAIIILLFCQSTVIEEYSILCACL